MQMWTEQTLVCSDQKIKCVTESRRTEYDQGNSLADSDRGFENKKNDVFRV